MENPFDSQPEQEEESAEVQEEDPVAARVWAMPAVSVPALREMQERGEIPSDWTMADVVAAAQKIWADQAAAQERAKISLTQEQLADLQRKITPKKR